MFSRKLIVNVAVIAMACAGTAGGLAAELSVDNARLRTLLPGQTKTAGYFDVTNNGPQPITLLGASSEAAAAIEFHRSSHTGNVVSMRRVEKVVVGPAETVRFAPGGLHLMLFRVSALTPSTRIALITGSGERFDAMFRLVPTGVE